MSKVWSDNWLKKNATKLGLKIKVVKLQSWTCKVCGAENMSYELNCMYCGAEKDVDKSNANERNTKIKI